MRWTKKGVIFTAANQYEWMAHHACVPVADKVDERTLRIYFGPRDRQGRTRTTFIEVDLDNPARVLRVHDRPVLDLQPRRFFQQAMLITLLNPKAIVFYMAFFPLFVDPARHQGLLTFGVMAATIAALTFLYCVIVISITHFAADRMRASPRVAVWLNRVAGTVLVGFGVKLALGK